MTPPVPPSPAPAPRGVRRSRGGAVLGGVCAGVARSAGLDPLLLRIAVVAVTVLTGGAGLPAYLVAWVLIPREDAGTAALPPLTGVGAHPTGEGTGTDVRAAWTAAGHDLRSLAAELRRPAGHTAPPGPGPSASDPSPTEATPTEATPTEATPTEATPIEAATTEAATTGTMTTGTTTYGTTDGRTGPDGSPPPEPDADGAPSAPPAGSIPSPRSPLVAADDAVTALGDRLRAPEVEAGARKAATSVSEALNASVDELGRRLRRDPG